MAWTYIYIQIIRQKLKVLQLVKSILKSWYTSTHSEPWHYMEVCGHVHASTDVTPRKESGLTTGQEPACISHPVWTQWEKRNCLASAGE